MTENITFESNRNNLIAKIKTLLHHRGLNAYEIEEYLKKVIVLLGKNFDFELDYSEVKKKINGCINKALAGRGKGSQNRDNYNNDKDEKTRRGSVKLTRKSRRGGYRMESYPKKVYIEQ